MSTSYRLLPSTLIFLELFINKFPELAERKTVLLKMHYLQFIYGSARYWKLGSYSL
jgi:hypothetical protein